MQRINKNQSTNGIWQDYTPTTSNITVGSGTLHARYCRIGNTIELHITFILGSGSAVSGNPTFSLPVQASAEEVVDGSNWIRGYQGTGRILSGASTVAISYCLFESATTIGLRAMTANGTYVAAANITSSVPMTWASGDRLIIRAVYECVD